MTSTQSVIAAQPDDAPARGPGPQQALRLIVCDWNGTLLRDKLEETFFFGLSRRAVWRALRGLDVPALFRLGVHGLQCLGHYLAARWNPRHVPEHIGRIMDLLNRDVFSGLRRDELADYTRRYARRIQGRLDRRLLEPLMALDRDGAVALGIISAGCREGITAALDEARAPFDFVIANEFRMAGEVTEFFDFALAGDKRDVLLGVLAERNVPPESVMFIGDSPQDEQCLAVVGYPVVSFFANGARKRQLAADCGAFVPADRADLSRHIASALSGP